jgi:hypothetical protein
MLRDYTVAKKYKLTPFPRMDFYKQVLCRPTFAAPLALMLTMSYSVALSAK